MKKIVSRTILGITIVIIVLLALVHFLPGYNMYLVRSESMVPAINMGDLVITGPPNGPLNGEVTAGTVVTYDHGKELITHRVLGVDGESLITKGDAAEEADPWSVTMSDVRGILLFKIPSMGYVIDFMQTKSGWFLVIIIPAALLVALLVKDIFKEAWSSEKNKSTL